MDFAWIGTIGKRKFETVEQRLTTKEADHTDAPPLARTAPASRKRFQPLGAATRPRTQNASYGAHTLHRLLTLHQARCNVSSEWV